jgi:phosphoribosyl-ATP pyrophosphohydrolase
MANVLTRLARTIESRKGEDEEKSYAAKLFKRGPEKCAEKFGEEAIEAIIAAAKGDKKNLTEEAADVLFHLFVMLSARDVKFEDVLKELERREGKSGIVEKAERKNKS